MNMGSIALSSRRWGRAIQGRRHAAGVRDRGHGLAGDGPVETERERIAVPFRFGSRPQ